MEEEQGDEDGSDTPIEEEQGDEEGSDTPIEEEQGDEEGSDTPIEDEQGDGWSDATTLVLGHHNPEDFDEIGDSEDEMPPLMNGGSPVASPASPASEGGARSPKNTNNGWNEELFRTPPDFKGGLPRYELIEMCVALMQFLGEKHPEILKTLGFFIMFLSMHFCLDYGSCVAPTYFLT